MEIFNGTTEVNGSVLHPSEENGSQHARAILGLRAMLLRGDLRPGDRIAELPLAAKLGVSRTPLRLALEKLQYEGLVEDLPSGGFAVCAFSIDDVCDALETRGVLEGTAARLAAERLIDSRPLQPLHALNEEMGLLLPATDETFPRYLELNRLFHSHIYDLAGSRILRRAAEQLYRLPFTSPSALVLNQLPETRDLLMIGQQQHSAILEAIEHREGARAESVAREHGRVARRNFQIAVENRPILDSLPGAYLLKARAAGK